MNTLFCKKCRTNQTESEAVKKTVNYSQGQHIGAYCVKCGAYLKWLPKPFKPQSKVFRSASTFDQDEDNSTVTEFHHSLCPF